MRNIEKIVNHLLLNCNDKKPLYFITSDKIKKLTKLKTGRAVEKLMYGVRGVRDCVSINKVYNAEIQSYFVTPISGGGDIYMYIIEKNNISEKIEELKKIGETI